MRILGVVVVLLSLASAVCAQWHRLPGPPAGGPYCFIEIPDSTRIYAGTIDGVWLSTDHMKSWSRAGIDGQYVTLISEYWDPANGMVLFAATYDAIYRTRDSGQTWTHLEGPSQSYLAGAPIVGLFQNSSNVFVVFSDAIDTATCVWRSSDLGDSWTRFAPYVPNLYGPNSVDTMNGTLFALMEDGQFHDNLFSLSLAGGQWQPLDYTSGHNLSVIKADGQNLYAAGRDVWTTTAYFDVSTDAGVTWTPLLSRRLDSILSPPDAIAVKGLNFVIDFDRDTYVSTDGGGSWNHLDRHGEFSEGRALGVIDGGFLLSEGTGLFKSMHALNWVSVPVPAQSPEVNVVATTQTSLFAVGSWGTLFQSTDKGQSWIEPGHLEGVNQLAGTQQTLFASWYGGLGRWSTDHWDSLGLPYGVDGCSLLADHDTIFYTDGFPLWLSTDLGNSWQQQSTPTLHSLCMFSDTLFAITSRQSYRFYELDFDLSTDWGTSWHHRSTLATDSGYFSGETLLAADSGSIFMSLLDTGLLASSNAGYTWQLIDTDHVRSLTPIGTSIFASLSSRTPDHPSGLYDITNGFRLIVPDSITSPILTVAADDSFLYVGTQLKGLWVSRLSEIPLTASVVPTARPNSLEVYPNPTRGIATVTYSLPARSHTRLVLVSELGVEVAMLFDGMSDAGRISLPLALGGLPNGIYEIKMSGDKPFASGVAKFIISK